MRKNNGNPDILFLPYWPHNPYQPNIVEALGKINVRVTGVNDTTLVDLTKSARGKDILHMHWTRPYMIVPSLLLSVVKSILFIALLAGQKIAGRKLVWTIHNLVEHERRHPALETIGHRILARLADGIIVHSDYAKKETVRAYRLEQRPAIIRVIPHGHYLDNYPNTISRDEARTRLGIANGKKVFLFFGRIRPYKGIPELVAAFNKISTGNEVLALAGNPLNKQYGEEIEQLVAGQANIRLVIDFVPDDDIQLYMNAADLVVFPFRDIFTSGSVLLAMSFAKAMIIPDLPSLVDIKQANGSICYDPDDPRGLETAMQTALAEDLVTMGQRNLTEARQFSWESIAEDTSDLYRQVL